MHLEEKKAAESKVKNYRYYLDRALERKQITPVQFENAVSGYREKRRWEWFVLR